MFQFKISSFSTHTFRHSFNTYISMTVWTPTFQHTVSTHVFQDSFNTPISRQFQHTHTHTHFRSVCRRIHFNIHTHTHTFQIQFSTHTHISTFRKNDPNIYNFNKQYPKSKAAPWLSTTSSASSCSPSTKRKSNISQTTKNLCRSQCSKFAEKISVLNKCRKWWLTTTNMTSKNVVVWFRRKMWKGCVATFLRTGKIWFDFQFKILIRF